MIIKKSPEEIERMAAAHRLGRLGSEVADRRVEETVAGALVLVPSLAVNVKASGPW